MILPNKSEVMVLIPVKLLKLQPWNILKNKDIELSELSFGSKLYGVIEAVVLSNPKHAEVTNGIDVSDITFGFKEGNYGSILSFPLHQKELCITWREVLSSKDVGIQVWQKGDFSRDLTTLFDQK